MQEYTDEETASAIIRADYCEGVKKRDIPPFMKHLTLTPRMKKSTSLNSRQIQHL
jgi:hypothetical protein